jgi:hypothetical protein
MTVAEASPIITPTGVAFSFSLNPWMLHQPQPVTYLAILWQSLTSTVTGWPALLLLMMMK